MGSLQALNWYWSNTMEGRKWLMGLCVYCVQCMWTCWEYLSDSINYKNSCAPLNEWCENCLLNSLYYLNVILHVVIIQYYTLIIQEAVTVCACSDHHHTQKETVYLDVLLAMYVHDVHVCYCNVPLACGRKYSMGNVCSHFLSPSHTHYNDWDNNSCHRFD